MNGELQTLSNSSQDMFIQYVKDYFATTLPEATGFSYTYGLTRDEFREIK